MAQTTGIPLETAPDEGRVAAVPSDVRGLRARGDVVLVEQSAGLASGFTDEDYLRAGAELVPTAEELYARADRVWKVRAPSSHERTLLREGQGLIALFHAEPPPPGVVAVRAELLEREGRAPAREAMSEIAGRLALEAASVALGRAAGGRGLYLGGVPGVAPAVVVVLGAGVAGREAAAAALARGALVEVLDLDLSRLRDLARALPGLRTSIATEHAVERALAGADVVIAAVRGPPVRGVGAAHLALMSPGAVVVDLSILDGGAFATTPLTTLSAPTRLVQGIVHVGVPNFAGGVPRTASPALSHAVAPFL